jgi:cytochrome c oxidase subunit II
MSQLNPIPPSAVDWNNFFALTGAIGLIALAVVVGAMVYFVLSDRKIKVAPPAGPVHVSRVREFIIVASISAILLFSLSIASFRMTADLQYSPADSETYVINVIAQQWFFSFGYPNNVTSIHDCYVPAGRIITFNVTSIDVMHNFGLPDFKLKIDAIPGRYNILWITIPTVNQGQQLHYHIRCYEMCGVLHTYMTGDLIVLEQSAFDQWLSNQTMTNMTAVGG